MATSKEKAKFAAERLIGFFKIFLRNPKGIFGIIILLMFIVMIAGAPLFTPYDPIKSDYFSGTLGAPVWLKYLPSWLGGRPDLSENMQVVKDPGFDNQPAINSTAINEDWKYIKSPNITLQYEPNIGNPYEGGTPGCLKISFKRDQVGTLYGNHSIYIYKDYYYPYSGPPSRFFGLVAFFLNGSAYTVEGRFYNTTSHQVEYGNITYFHIPVKINVIFQQVDYDQKWVVYPIPQFVLAYMRRDGTLYRYIKGVYNRWELSKDSPGSNASDIDSRGYKLGQGLFQGANAIPRLYTKTPGTYRYAMEITFQDTNNAYKNIPVNSTIYIDDLNFRTLGTSWGIMGTDQYGRDLFTELLYGAAVSLYVGVLSAVLAIVIGLIVGLVAGYFGGIVDELLMRFNDMLLVLPGLPLLIILMAVLGSKIENLIILLGLHGFARIVRSQVLSLKERPFIEAAKAVGAGRAYILTRHLIPNVMSLTYVSLATTVPGNIVAEAALSFLGFYDPYRISWGRMLYDVQFRAGAISNWWWVVPPGLCIALLSISFILLGYALDDVLNPKLRMRR